MVLRALPVIPRTSRPSIAGTPVWYAEATQARTQLDLNVTIPSGDARKLLLLWGSDGGEFPTAVTFDPAGEALPLTGIVAEALGTLRAAAYYLDAPAPGSKVVRIATANPTWSVAYLVAIRDARAGVPEALSDAIGDTTSISSLMEPMDAFSISHDLVLGDGIGDGDLTPASGQTAGADNQVNASFVGTTSARVHDNSGAVPMSWTATSATALLQVAVNTLFSTGQIAQDRALSLWHMNETAGATFADAEGRSSLALVAGSFSVVDDPLLDDGGDSLSIQVAQFSAANHVDWQVPTWSVSIYCQPRSMPSAGTNRIIVNKDTALVPGGWSIEQYNDGGTSRLRAYIRNSVGGTGSGTFIGASTGQGNLSVDVAHRIDLTFDGTTARLYLDRSEVASSNSASLHGMQDNAAPMEVGWYSPETPAYFDGIVDRLELRSGALSAGEIAAAPAPTTITDPDAPGAITAVSDNVGNVTPGTTTDVDVLANDTGKTGPHYDIEIVSDPAARGSVINDQSATAQIRLTMPAAPSSTTNESLTYRVREGTSPTFGNPSNQAVVSWTRQGTAGGGGYTPFPFVTISNPSVTHSGVANRPGYSATNPRSASIIDPMSGLEVFRVGGNTGSTVFINGTTNSGFVFPRRLRNQNNSKGFMVWNADSTLLMISRRFSQTNDPANSASSYIIDVDGSHGASAPWRIIRVNPAQDLAVSGLSADWFFWDILNPLRAYAVGHNGSLWEWWPIGAPGHSVGEKTQIFGPLPSGFGNVHGADDRPGACTPTPDGVFRTVPCQRSSDGRWGGFRQNIQTGAMSSFVVSPDFNYTGSSLTDGDRCAQGLSALGTYVSFNENGHRFKFKRWSDGTEISDTAPENLATHTCMVVRNGVEYFCGVRTDNVSMFNIAADTWEEKITTAQFQGANPNHLGALNWNDTFETYGATGSGSTTGVRYFLYTRSNSRNGHPRAILGIRMGANDTNQFRYLCNHRSVRSSNSSECHAQMDPNAQFVAFNSNWQEPGVVSDADVHPYVCVIPDAWRSPNNDGS